MIKVMAYFKKKSRGQSFVELAIVLMVLLLLLTGMVEFGNLLNVYINLTDGAREGARFGSNNDPYYISKGGTYDYSAPQQSFYTDIDKIVEGDTNYFPATKRTSAIAPLVLDPNTYGLRKPSGEAYQADNVLITFYSVDHGQIVKKLGFWSKYDSSAYPNANQTSRIPASEIALQLDPSAPGTGILVVEVFYNYHQLLKLPLFTVWVADPIPVHAYAIMPLAGAEATPTP